MHSQDPAQIQTCSSLLLSWNFLKISLQSSLSADSTVELDSGMHSCGYRCHELDKVCTLSWSDHELLGLLPCPADEPSGHFWREEQAALSVCTQPSASLGRHEKSCPHSSSTRCQVWVVYINLCWQKQQKEPTTCWLSRHYGLKTAMITSQECC